MKLNHNVDPRYTRTSGIQPAHPGNVTIFGTAVAVQVASGDASAAGEPGAIRMDAKIRVGAVEVVHADLGADSPAGAGDDLGGAGAEEVAEGDEDPLVTDAS